MLDINTIEWTEFWIDPTSLYILLLIKFKNKDNLFILDYRLQQIEKEFISYEEAKNYLLEDEYTLIKGKVQWI
jgi:hypothetical protein